MSMQFKFTQFYFIYLVILSPICAQISLFEIKLNHAHKSPQFIATNADSLNPMILKLYDLYHNAIHECTFYPNQTDIFYQCDENNSIHYNSTIQHQPDIAPIDVYDTNFKTNVKLSIEYNSSIQLFIDSIKLYENGMYYEINQFCVPKQYNHLLFSITTRRLSRCRNSPISSYQFPKYRDLSIGQQTGMTHHIINFLPDFRSFPNQTMSAFVIPPPIQQFGIHVTPKQFHNLSIRNPQTKDPVTLTLYWYDKQHQCTIYPTQPDTEYLCNIGDDNVYSSDINLVYFGKNILKMEKAENSTDALAINLIIVRDITNTLYGIKDFCVNEDYQKTAKFCNYKHMNNARCNGYLGTDLDATNSNEYLKCSYSCIDSDGCGSNSLLFYFVKDLYTLNNVYAKSRLLAADDEPIDHESNALSNKNKGDDKNKMVYIILLILSVIVSIMVIALLRIMKMKTKQLEYLNLLIPEETPTTMEDPLTSSDESDGTNYSHLPSDDHALYLEDADWEKINNPADEVVAL